MAEKKLANYLQHVISDYQKDNDTTKALRRLHIKQVHLVRKGNYEALKILKNARRLI